MSIIVPAGVNEVKWSPVIKQASMTKTASTDTSESETQEIQDDKDILYQAAQKVIADREAKEAEETKVVEAETETEDVKETETVEATEATEETEVVEAEEKTEIKEASEDEPCDEDSGEDCGDSDDGDDGDDDSVVSGDGDGDGDGDAGDESSGSDPAATIQEAVAELSEKADTAEAAAEVVEEAVETISQVVEEVKEQLSDVVSTDVSDVSDVSDGDGISIDDGGEEAVIEVVDTVEGIPGEPHPEEEVDMVVESDEEGIFALSTDNMVKLSKLSPENRSKLDSYWKSFYGDASDWIDLLTKDYEK